MEIRSSEMFLLKLGNFSGKEIFLRKGSVVVLATEVQSVMIVGNEKELMPSEPAVSMEKFALDWIRVISRTSRTIPEALRLAQESLEWKRIWRNCRS
jgi:hypothetical protein